MEETKRKAPRNLQDLTREEYRELIKRREEQAAYKFQKMLQSYGYDLEKCEFK